MKQQLTVFCLLFLLQNGFAQEEGSSKKYSLKVYNITSYEKNSDRYNESTEMNIIKPSFAFQWKTTNRVYQEIELMNLHVSNKQNRGKNVIAGGVLYNHKYFKTDIALRYEVIYALSKSDNKKWMPAIGLGINPYFLQEISNPVVSYAFKTSLTNTGAGIYIIPRMVYNISERVYLDINIPVLVTENNFEISKVENPGFTREQQRTTTFTSTQFPSFYSGRIGLGIRI